MMLPGALALAIASFALLSRENPALVRAFLGAAVALGLWSTALYASTRRGGRKVTLDVVPRRQHWLQACAQGTVFLYWGWHTPIVYTFLPFILAQLLFAYAFDALLSWSRRGAYSLGFGPFPIVFSISLFLWFRLEWFHWQFAMIALGFLAKELIRWKRDGRPAHIFNPSAGLAGHVSGRGHPRLTAATRALGACALSCQHEPLRPVHVGGTGRRAPDRPAIAGATLTAPRRSRHRRHPLA